MIGSIEVIVAGFPKAGHREAATRGKDRQCADRIRDAAITCFQQAGSDGAADFAPGGSRHASGRRRGTTRGILGLGALCEPEPNSLPATCGFATPGDPSHFAADRLRLHAWSAHWETVGVAMSFGSFLRYSALSARSDATGD